MMKTCPCRIISGSSLDPHFSLGRYIDLSEPILDFVWENALAGLQNLVGLKWKIVFWENKSDRHEGEEIMESLVLGF